MRLWCERRGFRPTGPLCSITSAARLPSAGDQERLAELIRKLDSKDFQTRRQATADLTAAGPKALALLRAAAADSSLEVKRRVQECIAKIEQGLNADVTFAVVRLLKERKPAGAAATLLDFLPQVDQDDLEGEILLALLVLGVREGTPDELFAKAVSDKAPARRAAAALVLGRHGSGPQRAEVKGLLADADMRVRLRAAQGLLAGKDKSAVPNLLALVSEGPVQVAELAVELLGRLAGAEALAVPLGANDAERRKCRAAWEAWWKTSEAKLDLARADLDLFQPDLSRRARNVVEKLLKTIDKGGPRIRFIGYPFCFLGKTINQQEPIDEYMGALAIAMTFTNGRFAVEKVVELTDFDAEKSDPGAAQFVAGLRKNEVRAVYVQFMTADGKVDPRLTTSVWLVRFAAGKMQVIGLTRKTRN